MSQTKTSNLKSKVQIFMYFIQTVVWVIIGSDTSQSGCRSQGFSDRNESEETGSVIEDIWNRSTAVIQNREYLWCIFDGFTAQWGLSGGNVIILLIKLKTELTDYMTMMQLHKCVPLITYNMHVSEIVLI